MGLTSCSTSINFKRSVEFPTLNVRIGVTRREPLMISVKFIRDKARKILREFGVAQPPVPVRDIAEGHALTIEDVEREDSYSGELVPELRRIKVNVRKSKAHQRYTIAHELGHWVLYHKERLLEDESLPLESDPQDLDESDFDDQAAYKAREGEASDFAAELLMPTQWVKADWKKYRRDVKRLIAAYEVSEEAMWRRITELGLINK
jgi:predicted transcriptional regulator